MIFTFGIAPIILIDRDLSTCLGRKGDAVQTSKRLPVQEFDLLFSVRIRKKVILYDVRHYIPKNDKKWNVLLKKDISWTGV